MHGFDLQQPVDLIETGESEDLQDGIYLNDPTMDPDPTMKNGGKQVKLLVNRFLIWMSNGIVSQSSMNCVHYMFIHFL